MSQRRSLSNARLLAARRRVHFGPPKDKPRQSAQAQQGQPASEDKPQAPPTPVD